MTDLTAAPIVAKNLRELSDSSDHFQRGWTTDSQESMRSAAILIEQQADEIAQLTTTTAEDKRHMDKQAEHIAALRNVIEDAPHDGYCPERTNLGQYYCTCWKSKALAEKEQNG